MFKLTQDPIDTQSLLNSFMQPRAGAVVTFDGRVRDHSEGREVSGLSYEAFHLLAQKEGQKILEEAHAKFSIIDALGVHRTGDLKINEIAVSIIVISGHRDAAFLACRYIIDEIKHRVPIWKKEHYLTQPSKWVDCPGCAHNSHTASHTASHTVSYTAAHT